MELMAYLQHPTIMLTGGTVETDAGPNVLPSCAFLLTTMQVHQPAICALGLHGIICLWWEEDNCWSKHEHTKDAVEYLLH